MATKGQTYNWAVPNRLEVSKLRYQLRRFQKQLAAMDVRADDREAIAQAIHELDCTLDRRYE